MSVKIGIDLGGTTLVAARVFCAKEAAPRIDRKIFRNTPSRRSVPEVLSLMAEMIADLASEGDVSGVGVAVPGMIDPARRIVHKMPNFPRDWEEFDLLKALLAITKMSDLALPVKLENDANCYALGEGNAGVAVGMTDYVVLTLGTGIGCGVVLGGRLLVGSHGMAGEAGHLVVNGQEPCNCGGLGHAETVAGADGTAKRAKAAGLTGNFRELWELRHGHGASKILGATVDAMARTVASISHLLDPEAIVLGGGISQASGIAEVVHDAALPYLSRPFRHVLRLEVSRLGNEAAIYGAASL